MREACKALGADRIVGAFGGASKHTGMSLAEAGADYVSLGPIGEGLALFEALQLHDVESELLVFPDEGHWITKPRNVVAFYDHLLAFLAKHLSAP